MSLVGFQKKMTIDKDKDSGISGTAWDGGNFEKMKINKDLLILKPCIKTGFLLDQEKNMV